MLRSFWQSPVGSRAFNTRLIELVAVAVHEIGSMLFQLHLEMHQGDIARVDQWNETPPGANWRDIPPKPNLFNHHVYVDYDVYPNGIADLVGYWAENRILGGVTVFCRPAEKSSPALPPNVFFHSCRRRVTYRYDQLRDEQQEALLGFLLAENPDATKSPLPILADKRDVLRVDEEDSVRLQLYRDEWERKPPTPEQLEHRTRACQSTLDYPEFESFIEHLQTFPTTSIAFPGMPAGAATDQPQRGGGDTEQPKGKVGTCRLSLV